MHVDWWRPEVGRLSSVPRRGFPFCVNFSLDSYPLVCSFFRRVTIPGSIIYYKVFLRKFFRLRVNLYQKLLQYSNKITFS